MGGISFSCPSCGGGNLFPGANPESYQGLIGAICLDCGHKLTEEEVEGQARDFIDRAVEALFQPMRRWWRRGV